MAQTSKKISFRSPSPKIENTRGESRSRLSNGHLSSSFSDLRSKINPNNDSLDSTMALEAEYIKSLQQQIYLLELENNHLRQQTLKAAEIHPVMTSEAEKMVENLKILQRKVNSLELELFRKEGHVDLLNSKISQLSQKLEHENDKHGKEKNVIISDAVTSKMGLDHLERELCRKNVLLKELKDDLQRTISSQQSAENKVEMLRAQLQEEMAKTREAEMRLAEKKSEMFDVDKKLRELEGNYSRQNNSFHENIKKELRDEILFLKTKLSEATDTFQREQTLRSQLSNEANSLIKENAILNRQILELQNIVENEKNVRERFENKRYQDDSELQRLRDREKDLEVNMRRLQQEVEAEKSRVSRLLQEISKQEKVFNDRMFEGSLDRKRPSDIDTKHISLEQENVRLKQDKENLIEHIDNLQQSIQKKDREIDNHEKVLREMETRVSQLEKLKNLDDTIQSKRWNEMAQTIDALKSKARLMTSASRPTEGRSNDRDPQKWIKDARRGEAFSYN